MDVANRLQTSDALVIVESDKIFTSEGAVAIREIVEALEKMDTVASVTWLDQAHGWTFLDCRSRYYLAGKLRCGGEGAST